MSVWLRPTKREKSELPHCSWLTYSYGNDKLGQPFRKSLNPAVKIVAFSFLADFCGVRKSPATPHTGHSHSVSLPCFTSRTQIMQYSQCSLRYSEISFISESLSISPASCHASPSLLTLACGISAVSEMVFIAWICRKQGEHIGPLWICWKPSELALVRQKAVRN